MTVGSRPAFVLDSYAVLAWLQGEAGEAAVDGLLRQAKRREVALSVCLVNVGEVLYIVERETSIEEAQRVLGIIDGLPVRQVVPTRSLTLQAAHYKATYRLSYADCYCMALARYLGAALVTGDPEFRAQTEVRLVLVG